MRKILSVFLFSLAAAFFLMDCVPAAAEPRADDKKAPGIKISWQAPKDVPASKVRGYNIYRSEQVMGHYIKLNRQPLQDISYEDRGLKHGKRFFYKVATIFTDGKESKATDPVGMTAGEPGAAEIRLPKINFLTSDAVGRITYLGDEAVFILEGDPGLKAHLDIEGVVSGLNMREAKPGTYKCVFKVKSGLKVKNTYARATLEDPYGGKSLQSTPETISFNGVKRPAQAGFYAGIVESDRIGLNWKRQEGFAGHYMVYRDTTPLMDTEGLIPVAANISGFATAYIDRGVEAGKTYYYLLAAVDGVGSQTVLSDSLEVKVPAAGRVSGMDVAEDSGGRTLKPGDKVVITLKAAAGGKAFFSLGSAVRDRDLAEKEPGVYTGEHVIKEGDGVFKSKVAVSLKDSGGASHFANSATFVSVDAPKTVGKAVSGRKPLVFEVMDDIRSVVGFSGKLTAGKTFNVTLKGEPGNKAFFNVGDGVWMIPMVEEPGDPGVYKGAYTVKPGDSAGMSPDPLRQTYLTAYLKSPAGVVSEPASSPVPVVIDTACDIKVEASETSLPADARSQSKITFTVTDADGEPVRDRRLSVLLEPPPHYTGVVGAGGMEMPGQQGLLGSLRVDFDDLTDSFGKVTATYTSGFAAKTAMIVARDFATGSVGMGYVTTSIASSVNVTLQPAAGGTAVTAPRDAVYQLQVDVLPDPGNPIRKYPYYYVEAVPNLLTADGVSRANIIATLTKDGKPVEGKTILFAVSGAGGRLTANSGKTDISGRAQVFYIAGIKAGKAVVTATEASTGVSVDTVITLLADAPARIYAKAYPDTLPADGASSSRIVVELADVNNNPTEGIGVRFALRGGASRGMIGADSGVTDFRGACDFIYTAGTQPGVATIDISAASPPPAADELRAAGSRIMAPLVYDNYDYTELMIIDWYKSAGDPVGRGEPVALVGTPLGSMAVYSPVSGTLERITVDKGINVIEGKEIGAVR